MDYTLHDTPILTTNEVLNTATQQSVDLDFTLPDYCADIEKILKCSMKIKLFSKNCSSGILTVTGETVITILYTDTNKKALRCFEQSEPFTITIPVNGQISECISYVTSKPEYINCRALTQRRVTVHGSFTLNASILERKLIHLFSQDKPCDLQTKEKEISLYETKIFTDDRLNISEAVTFGTRKPVETIVTSRLSANLDSFTFSKERLELKGDLTLRLLYITDASTGEVDHYVCSIPFSEVVKVTDELCDVSNVTVSVSSFDVTLKRETVTDEPVIHLEASLRVEALGFKETGLAYICDAYSTDFDTNLEYAEEKIITKVESINYSLNEKSEVSLGDNKISKVLDIFYDAPHFKAYVKGGGLEINGKLDISILAITSDEELICIDRQITIDNVHTLEGEYNNIDHIQGNVSSISYRIGEDNRMELRYELSLKCLISQKTTINGVISAKTLSDTKKEKSNLPLTLYYAQKGESLWEISKRYSIYTKSLLEENSLTEDELESPGMIMIIST